MVAWEQPTLTSNGTMGGDSFAVAASSTVWSDGAQAWGAFNPDSFWHADSSSTQWIAWYNPKPLKVTKFQLLNRNTPNGDSDTCAATT